MQAGLLLLTPLGQYSFGAPVHNSTLLSVPIFTLSLFSLSFEPGKAAAAQTSDLFPPCGLAYLQHHPRVHARGGRGGVP